jgi:hypothetical protein
LGKALEKIVRIMMDLITYTLFANVVRKMKSRWMRWVGHVACMAEKTNASMILLE